MVDPYEVEMTRAESEGRWDIWHAAKAGRLNWVKAALENNRSLLMCPDMCDRTPLYYASLGMQPKVVGYLLSQGASDPDGTAEIASPSDRIRLMLKGKPHKASNKFKFGSGLGNSGEFRGAMLINALSKLLSKSGAQVG